MKRFLLSIISLCASLFIIAQESVFPKQLYTNLSHVAIDNNNIFAIGSCGVGQISIDGGTNWEIFQLDDDSYMRGMEIKPNSNGTESYLINYQKLYILNIDQSLQEVNTTPLNAYGSMRGMHTDEEYIYIISDGAIHKAPHNTLEWEFINEVLYEEPYSINTTSSSSDYIYIASIEGHVFRSHKVTGDYMELTNLGNRINHLKMANDQVGYLTLSGASGPYKTTDGGSNWSEVLNWQENNPVHVYNENIFLTANTNRYFVSTDGGATSTAHYMFDDTYAGLINNVKFTDDGDFYMIGGSSTVLKSSNFGESYDNLLPRVRTNLYNIDFRGNTGIATGYNATLISEDNGENWIELNIEGLEDTNDGIVLNDNTYAIASDNGISIIMDGQVQSTSGPSASRVYAAVDNSYLLASMRIGTSNVIAKSTDNGLSWSNKIFNEDYLGKIKSNNQGLLYTTSGEGKYLQSEDDGETWFETILPVNDWFLDIAIEGSSALYSIGGTLYESKDNGATLTSLATGYLISNLHILGEDHYTYTTGSNSSTVIYERKADSNNFSVVANSCGVSYGSYYKEGDEIWYSKAGGHIAKYSFDITNATIEVKDNSVKLHPNPIYRGEPMLIQGIEKIGKGIVTDNMGRVVKEFNLSDSQINIDTNSLTPGNYIVTIKTRDNINSTKLVVF